MFESICSCLFFCLFRRRRGWGMNFEEFLCFVAFFTKQYGLTKLWRCLFRTGQKKHTELSLYDQFKDLIMILRWAIFPFFPPCTKKVFSRRKNMNPGHLWNIHLFRLSCQFTEVSPSLEGYELFCLQHTKKIHET